IDTYNALNTPCFIVLLHDFSMSRKVSYVSELVHFDKAVFD
ncbi:MAG: hypothetical protein Athens071426_636, partial [Parcubacteria group bacterium Athens0714_26]